MIVQSADGLWINDGSVVIMLFFSFEELEKNRKETSHVFFCIKEFLQKCKVKRDGSR